MKKLESWGLYKNSGKKDYYLQEFYSGKIKKIPQIVGKELFKLESKKREHHEKACNYEVLINDIMANLINWKED